MRLAIMQPYFFPYIGYFQLCHAADHFIFFDDVNFITQGWINRNKILIESEPKLFTIPLRKASQNKKINEVEVDLGQMKKWRIKFKKTLLQNYGKSPYFDEVITLINNVLDGHHRNISELAIASIKKTAEFLELPLESSKSSKKEYDRDVTPQEKVFQLCKQTNATEYINLPGGKQLYKKVDFENHNIKLQFLTPFIHTYPQLSEGFTSHLSILDIMFLNSKETAKKMIANYAIENL